MQTKIAIEFDNLASEHIHAARVYDARGIFGKGNKIVAVILALVGAWMVYMAGLQWWTVIWFALVPIEWFDLLSIRPLQVLVQFKINPKYRETYRLEFDDTGLRFKTATVDSKLAWNHFNRVIESDKVFLLIYGKMMYSVIPKRAFASEAEIDDFRQLLNRNIG